jgi:hypothetical protein
VPLLIRGLAVCETCKKVASIEAAYSKYSAQDTAWWELPFGWRGYTTHTPASLFCSPACASARPNAKEYYLGSPDLIGGNVVQTATFDNRAMVKLIELTEAKDGSDNDTLNAILAVLTAWQTKQSGP